MRLSTPLLLVVLTSCAHDPRLGATGSPAAPATLLSVEGVSIVPDPDPRLEAARTEPDLGRRAAILQALLEEGSISRSIARAARTRLIVTLADAGRIREMEAAAGALEIGDDRDGALLLDRMARAYARGPGDPERGLRHARRALEVVEGFVRPKGANSSAFHREKEALAARMRATLGTVLLAAGDAPSAVRELSEAASVLSGEGEVACRLAEALEAAGKNGQAVDWYVRAIVADGPESERATRELARAAVRAGLQEYEWRAKVTAARGAMAAEMRLRAPSFAVDLPLPALSSVPEAGRELPTVLLFWASWDDRSIQALRAVAELASREGAGFRLATVSVDRSRENAALGASRIGVPFQWDLDPVGADVAACSIRTLPTSLLAVNGRVRYRNEGWTVGYEALLKAQLDMVGGQR